MIREFKAGDMVTLRCASHPGGRVSDMTASSGLKLAEYGEHYEVSRLGTYVQLIMPRGHHFWLCTHDWDLSGLFELVPKKTPNQLKAEGLRKQAQDLFDAAKDLEATL